VRRARTNDGQTNKMVLVSRQATSTVSRLALIEMSSLHELNARRQHQLKAKQNSGRYTPFSEVCCTLWFSRPPTLGLTSIRRLPLSSLSTLSREPFGAVLKCVVLHVIGCTWGSTYDEGSQLFGCGLRSVI
jgi:hypothetical protein